MGLCHSACGSRTYELEYYNEAYRHQSRLRAHDKLVDESLAADASAAKFRAKQRRLQRRQQLEQRSGGKQHPTQLWLCDDGCCSIRWKLDYAAFQSYTIYAQVSPYVVVQDQTGQCACVICKGMPEKAGDSGGTTPAVLRRACSSYRLDASALQELLPLPGPSSTSVSASSSDAASSTASSLGLSDGSTTDDDDDDDGSI